MLLPRVKSTVSESLLDYTWLIYGRVKIGKTTLLSQFPKCLHFMWEPGAKAVSIYKVPVKKPSLTDWKQGVRVVSDIEKYNDKETFQFRTVCFDTGEKAYKRCLAYMTSKLGAHPNEKKDFGASWEKVAEEFQSLHTRIINMGIGFVVIAHETEKEFEDWDGKTYDQIKPKFSNNVASFYEGIIDNICYYHFVGRNRFLQIRGDKSVVAGTRCDGKFLTPEGFLLWKEIQRLNATSLKESIKRRKVFEVSSQLKRHMIIKIPMGNTAQEAYSNLLTAFDNKQQDTYSSDEKIIKRKGGRL